MQNHNDGETPNNDTPEPGDPALQGNNGSEPANQPAADENNGSTGKPKRRRTAIERLVVLQAKRKEDDLKERQLLKSVADEAKEETKKFTLVLGGSALHEIKTMKSHEGARNLLVLLRKRVTKEDQRWADANFDRLAIQILELRKQEGDANGESPSQT